MSDSCCGLIHNKFIGHVSHNLGNKLYALFFSETMSPSLDNTKKVGSEKLGKEAERE